MENIIDKTKELVEHSKEYLETYVKYQLLQAIEKVAGAVANIVYGVLGLFFLLFILMFLGIGTGIWIGHLTNSMEIGFFSVAGIFILLMLILLFMRKKLVIPFLNNLIIKILHVKEDD
jgi:hypothetical protein